MNFDETNFQVEKNEQEVFMKRRMKRNILFLLFCSVLGSWFSPAAGQTTDNADVTSQLLKTIVHPSPQAAAYARYGEYPVDYSTGVPRIEIPLYTLDTGDYQLPLSLSYHASGIKALDVSGPVGLGWVLNAGGVISRTACAIPDFDHPKYQMYFKNKGDVVKATLISPLAANVWNRIFLGDPSYDSESDRYSYNFAGKSGLFRYDVYTEKPFTIPHEPLLIERTGNGYEITDTDGTVYTFEAAETCTAPGMDSYVSAWYLTKITTAEQKHVINFTYTKGDTYLVRYRADQLHQGNEITFEPGTGNVYVAREFVNRYFSDTRLQTYQFRVPLLETISWNGETISLHYEKDRLDTQKERLTSITVKNSNTVVRYISLENGVYFGNRTENYRMKLNGVTIKGSVNGTESQHYGFTYNAMTPPDHYNAPNSTPATSPVCPEDYWGYNCGRSFTSLIPKGIFPSGGVDRSVSPEQAKMCMLQSITYPTGGKTEFTFESNRSTVTNELIGGLRVAAIVNKDSDGIELERKTYIYNQGHATMNVDNTLFSYWDYMYYYARNPNNSYQSISRPHQFAISSPVLPLTGWSGSPVFYSKVTEYKGTTTVNNGKTEYTYTQDFESSYPGSEEDDNLVPLPLGFYSTLYNNDEGIVPALLTSKVVYKKNGNDYVKQQTESYAYTELTPGRDTVSVGVRLGRMGIGSIFYENDAYSCAPYPSMQEYCDNIVYTTVRGYIRQRLLTKKTLTDHETGYSETHTYSYDGTLRGKLPVEETVTNSDGKAYKRKTYYAYLLPNELPSGMLAANYLDVPVKVEESYGGSATRTEHTLYQRKDGSYLPQSVKRSDNGGGERTLLTYTLYDGHGNPREATTLDGRTYVFLWSYGNRYPVMVIEGLTFSQVQNALGSSTVTSLASATNPGLTTLGNYAGQLPEGALATLYTYYPSVGVASERRPDGYTLEYTYDSLGRLTRVEDTGGVVETYEYHYE